MADSIEETDVAVVGAGGGGAVLALALASSLVGLLVVVLWLEGGNSRFDLWLALPLFLPALPLDRKSVV